MKTKIEKAYLLLVIFILSSILIQCKVENSISDFNKFTSRWQLYKIQVQDTFNEKWTDVTGNNKNSLKNYLAKTK